MAIARATKINAMREAKGLLQTFGFGGFSFQHVADLLGIKKPSLYEHFASKEALGQALVEDYHQTFAAWTETIEVFPPREQVGALFEMFFKFSTADRKVCPLSALIGDFNSLPKSMKKLLAKTFSFQREWLKNVIARGQSEQSIRSDQSSEELAELILAIGLGSQQIARVTDDPKRIRALKAQALSLLN